MSRQWFVGLTKEQQELRAAGELREQGFGVYLPKIHVRQQEGRKITARTGLRFTGYVFIACDDVAAASGPISHTGGMDDSAGCALLKGAGSLPYPVPASIIETLRQVEDEELGRALARKKPLPRHDLVPGELVSIAGDRGHPAYGRTGTYLGSEKGWGKVLAGIAVWSIPECDLRKVEDRKAA